MKWSAIVAIIVVIAVAAIWVTLFRVSDKHPDMMKSLAGCYLPTGADRSQRIDITASGSFQYRGRLTSIVLYEDKQSLSLLPKAKVVVGSDGGLEFLEGNPLLLRFDSDRHSFTVPSENGASLAFRKKWLLIPLGSDGAAPERGAESRREPRSSGDQAEVGSVAIEPVKAV